jgi:molybdopterin converting factor small subunit
VAVLIPFFDLGDTIGHRIEIEADTLGELVSEARARFGASFVEATKISSFVINGRARTAQKGSKTRLGPDDVVWMVRPSAGG